MAEIVASDARALFTKTLQAVYQERAKPTSFLKSFFKTKVAPTKLISIEVERMGEKIAVDVIRGTEGNRNDFSRSTEKAFLPPLFREYFDMTDLDLYDRVLGSQGGAQAPLFAALANSAADRMMTLKDKIDRSYELQCRDVLDLGSVITRNGTINFNRKNSSIVSFNSFKFTNNTINPFEQFAKAGLFLRTVGRSQDFRYNAIMAEDVLAALLGNTLFQARQNLYNMRLDEVSRVQRDALGAAYHGTITAGAYVIDLWTYPQFYDLNTGTEANPSFTTTPYIPSGKAYVIPANPEFLFSYAAVPQLVGKPGDIPRQGAYVYGEFLDDRLAKHDFDVQSAGLAIPVAVDQIYTMTNLV